MAEDSEGGVGGRLPLWDVAGQEGIRLGQEAGLHLSMEADVRFPGSGNSLGRTAARAKCQAIVRIPVPMKDDDGDPVARVQASYADFIWGVPPETDPIWPHLGLSTGMGEGEPTRKVIFVTKGSAADKAGFQTGDLLLTFDGTPVTDKEVLNRLLAKKRWGDTAVFTVKRGKETRTLTVFFRRQRGG
jgi:hypothetical protein